MATVAFDTGLVAPGQLIGQLADHQPALITSANARAFAFDGAIISELVRNAVNQFPAAADNTPLRAVVAQTDTSVAITVSTT